MKKSLQDQLIKAGLGNKQQARQINTAKKKDKSKDKHTKASKNTEPTISNAQAQRAEQAEKDRLRNLELQQAAVEKAEQSQITQLIESNIIPLPHRGQPYYFTVGPVIKKFMVTERIRVQLAFGQAGIVQLQNLEYLR